MQTHWLVLVICVLIILRIVFCNEMSVVISYNVITVDEFFADIWSTHAFLQLIDWPILLLCLKD